MMVLFLTIIIGLAGLAMASQLDSLPSYLLGMIATYLIYEVKEVWHG